MMIGSGAPMRAPLPHAQRRPHQIAAPCTLQQRRQHQHHGVCSQLRQCYWRIAAEPQQEASRGSSGSSDDDDDSARAQKANEAAAAAAGNATSAPPPSGGWAFASALSRRVSLDSALAEAAEAALRGCNGAAPTVAFLFASSAYGSALDLAVPLARRLLPPTVRCIVGCSGFGVAGAPVAGAGAPEEVEHAPALALALGAFPGVTATLRHVAPPDMPDGDAPPDAWTKLVGLPLADNSSSNDSGSSSSSDSSSSSSSSTSQDNFVIVADPAFARLEDLLGGLDFAYPAALKVGGLASSGRLSGARAVFCWSADDGGGGGEAGSGGSADTGVKRGGAAVLALRGPLALELMVAQGCRPLSRREYRVAALAPGRRDVVTLLTEVAPAAGGSGSGSGGSGAALAPVDALRRDLAEPLDGPVASERELAALVSNLCCGLAPDEPLLPPSTAASGPDSGADSGGAGSGEQAGGGGSGGGAPTTDYLIRGMALVGGGGAGGAGSGGLAVGDALRVGQRLRFMVRDRAGAIADLEAHGLAYKRRRLAAALGGNGGGGPPALGALLFSCNGRGSGLYGVEGYDAGRVAAYVGTQAVVGFQCNGEIGSLRGTTRLHGFTAAVAVMRGGG